MKTAAIPAVRVPPELRQAAEDALQAGETLSGFIEESVRRNVEYRQAQKAFIERGLGSAETARKSGMSRFRVRFTLEAEEDLLRLFDFLLEQDISAAERAESAIAKAIEVLEVFSFSCRKAIGGSGSPFLRELISPFGGAGFVAQFEIEDPRTVTILVVRHQREEDYH